MTYNYLKVALNLTAYESKYEPEEVTRIHVSIRPCKRRKRLVIPGNLKFSGDCSEHILLILSANVK